MVVRIGIVVLLLLLIYFIVKKYIHKEDISLKKIFFTIIILIYLIALHNFHMREEGEKVQKFVIAFKEGKTIYCKNENSNNKDINVTKDKYNFESGTLVFINNKIPEIRFSINECKLKRD